MLSYILLQPDAHFSPLDTNRTFCQSSQMKLTLVPVIATLIALMATPAATANSPAPTHPPVNSVKSAAPFSLRFEISARNLIEPFGCGSRKCIGDGGGTNITGFVLSRHAMTRMAERGISQNQVKNSLTAGKKYFDPAQQSTMYYRSGIGVATKGRTITTVLRGSPQGRMIPVLDDAPTTEVAW